MNEEKDTTEEQVIAACAEPHCHHTGVCMLSPCVSASRNHQTTKLPCDTFCIDPLWCIQRDGMCKKSAQTQTTPEAAYQRFVDANRRSQDMPPDTEPAWIIRYCDTEIEDEVFCGGRAEECARRRFDQQRWAWSISLFQEVARA